MSSFSRVASAVTLLAAVVGCSDSTAPASPPTSVAATASVAESVAPGATVTPSVTVTNAKGKPAAGVMVYFTTTGGSSADSVRTDATGKAQVVWTLPTRSGPYSLFATVDTLPFVRFDVDVAPGPATTVTVPASQLVMTVDSTTLPFVAHDQYGNVTTNGVTVSVDQPSVAQWGASGLTASSPGTATLTISGPSLANATVTVVVYRRLSLGARPFGVAVNGGKALVTTQDDGLVTHLTFPALAAQRTTSVGGNIGDVAFLPAGITAYAVSVGASRLARVDVATGAVLGTVTLPGGSAFRVRTMPDGGAVLATSTGALSILDPSTLATIATVPIPPTPATSVATGTPNGLAISPSGAFAYVTTNQGGLYEVSLAERKVTRSLSLGALLQDVVVSPDGSELYVANEGGSGFVVRTSDFVSVATFASPAFGLALTADGKTLVATSGGAIRFIDRATRLPLRTLSMGGIARRIAAAPDGTVLIADELLGVLEFK